MKKTKQERHFIDITSKHQSQVIAATENANMEGFEYFASEAYTSKPGNKPPTMKNKIKAMNPKDRPKFVGMMATCMPKMLKGMREGFGDVEYLLEELEEKGSLTVDSHPLADTYPNIELWKELEGYAWDKWQVKIGFTKMPQELIFKDKSVLYPYTIVCIQEMNKEAIDKAPQLDAGKEVQRVYADLGIAINDIAAWLRAHHKINCHSNHPLGGLVDTTPLAAKAGLGWQGHNGLLITPEFGQRHRIAPIFIESDLFAHTDNNDHRWIESFCTKCRRCEKNCPAQAIYPEKKVNMTDVDGIGQTRTCIDREKCYTVFNKTLGCAVCIKSCPFSGEQGSYDKLKRAYDKRKER